MAKKSMTGVSYIPDGFTVEGYLAPIPRLHGGCRFVYRPMLPHLRDFALQKSARQSPKDACVVFAEAIALQVQEWDIRDPVTGVTVPVTPENAKRLQPKLFSDMFAVVGGTAPSDAFPDEEDSPHDAAPTQSLKDALRAEGLIPDDPEDPTPAEAMEAEAKN